MGTLARLDQLSHETSALSAMIIEFQDRLDSYVEARKTAPADPEREKEEELGFRQEADKLKIMLRQFQVAAIGEIKEQLGQVFSALDHLLATVISILERCIPVEDRSQHEE